MVKGRTNTASGFSACFNRNDGIDVDEALKRAELHVYALSNAVSSGLTDAINKIGAIVGSGDESLSEEDGGSLYKLSDGIFSVAGLFKQEALGKAAHSFCDLLEFCKTHARQEHAAVRLHYNAIRLLHSTPDLSPSAQSDLIDNLERMVRSLDSSRPQQITISQ